MIKNMNKRIFTGRMAWMACFLWIFSIACSESEEINDADNYTPQAPATPSRSLKRGVSFNFQHADDARVLGKGIAWSYNWGPDQSTSYDAVVAEQQLDFCPMAWNGIDASRLRAYKSRHPECTYLLAFNEPNLTDQANMTPAQAAERWPALKAIADELGLKIISPAMNYGTLPGYGDPIVWLDEFFKLIPIADIEGISIHCYMPSAAATKSYIERFKKYNKPIWMTELCAWDGVNATNFKPEGQMKYMVDIINYMESDPAVFRYAWFIPRGDKKVEDFPYMYLLTKSANVELTALGKVFVQMSSQDKSVYYVEEQTIEAEHYASICTSESVGKNNTWVDAPSLRPTSDGADETLELYNFFSNQWVEYQVAIDRKAPLDLQLRYACFIDSELEISIDGITETTLTLPNTKEEFIWNTLTEKIHPAPGKHTVRLQVKKGAICLNWLRIGKF
jgi:hypothetical protein